MPDLRIHRPHDLGLEEARKIARDWVESARTQFDMACDYIEGEGGDRVAFSRSGVSGELRVGPDRFELEAKLGFLLGAFKDRIEQQISQNLDRLLAR